MKAMKKNSGTLKLDLAQYRELAAFSQFASDLDEATRAQLDRGARMMELLKQGINAPVPAIKQVCALYAGGKGYLDAIAVENILKFEEDLYSALDSEKKVLAGLEKEKNITEDIEKGLITVIKKVVELNK
jgi:F-type H+-transporting ATPase subunit alpha